MTFTFARETSINQPADAIKISDPDLSFKPGVTVGVRSNLITQHQDHANTVGPFVKPALELKVNKQPVTILAKYTLEMSGAKGIGSASEFQSVAKNTPSLANNTYYEHEPVIFISGGLSDNYKLNTLVDLIVHQDNEVRKNTWYELNLQPDITYAINPAFSLAVGYHLYRRNYYDGTVASDNTTTGLDASARAAVVKAPKPAFAAASTDVIGQNPLVNVNSAIVTATNQLAEKTKLVSYFRVGRQTSTISNRAGITYRFNTDLTTSLTKDLSAQLRYRIHVEDYNRAKAYFYNRGRVILSYALNPSWSLDVQNTFTVEQSTANTSQAKYTNENYAGATFKF